MPSNGNTATILRPEIGTVIEERDRLFVSFNDGAVFSPRDFEVEKVEQMLRVDGKAANLEQVLTLPLRAALTNPEFEGDNADFVREVLTKPDTQGGMSTPLELVLAQMTAACLFRRAYFEKVFRIDDGRVVFDKLAWRPPASCRMKWNKRDGAFMGFEQYVHPDHPRSNDQGYVLIPPERAFVFTHGTHRRPLHGTSDLEAVFNIWHTKQKIRFLWAAFLENQSTPKVLAKSETSDRDQIIAFAKKAAQLKGGGVLGLGDGQSVETYESNGTGAAQFEAAMRYLDAEMSGAVLAGFTDLTAQAGSGRGSYALHDSAQGFFKTSRQAVLNEMSASFTAFVTRDLVRYNLGAQAPVPKLKLGPLSDDSIEQAFDLLKQLASGPAVSPAIPQEFTDALIVKVAKRLNMDEGKIAEALQTKGNLTPTEQIAHGVSKALPLVQEAGLAGQPA